MLCKPQSSVSGAAPINLSDMLKQAIGPEEGGYVTELGQAPMAVVAAGVPIAYPTNPDGSSRQVIGANYFQVQNGKIVYMRTIHDSLPFAPLTNPVTVSS
jgi:hypothetical protein